MKYKSLTGRLLAISYWLFVSNSVFSQSTVIIGTGTNFNFNSAYPAPYGNYYFGAKHQMLVRASEMTAAGMAAGNISALAFQVNIPEGTALTGFTIGMKTTAVTAMGPSFDMSGMTTVYGPQNYTDVTGWNTHTFTTPFAWDGISNVLIETCFNNTAWSNNAQMYYTTTSFSSVAYYRQDLNNVCAQANGIVSSDRPNIKFTYTPNGPPTAQFTANPTQSCSGLVAFTDQSFYGITAWLWNFGDGATSVVKNPTHTYTASGTYSVSLKATNANGNNTLAKSNYIHVTLGSGPIPAACTPTTTAYCCGFGITNFKFDKINNTTADASEGYQDFSCGLDTVTTGVPYNISVSTLTPASHNVRVWIDLNNDGTFNPTGELVFSADTSYLATGTVTIPGTAILSTPLRLRVSADHGLLPAPTPCSNPQFGQAEDYGIYVKPNTNPPVSKFTVDDTLSCSGTVQFSDQSQNVPIQWLWNFGDGATSNSQSPLHTYSASGTYSVSLKATNGNGNNTLVKTNYIHVTLGSTPIAAACTPSTFSYCCGYGIYKVQLGAINRSSLNGVEGYKDFSCTDKASLTEGTAYPISIQTNPSNAQDTKVWIDLNNDGVFTQANELVFSSLNTINPSGSITIPKSVAMLNTILRMRVSSDGAGNNPNSCSSLLQGQAEDYGITVLQFVGTNEAQGSMFNVQCYPNPFTSSAVLAVYPPLEGAGGGAVIPPLNGGAHAVAGDVVFTLYDIYCRLVKEQKITSNETIINRNGLTNGIYIYKIGNGNQTLATGKLIIE